MDKDTLELIAGKGNSLVYIKSYASLQASVAEMIDKIKSYACSGKLIKEVCVSFLFQLEKKCCRMGLN